VVEPGMINTEFSEVVAGAAVERSKKSAYKEITEALLYAMSPESGSNISMSAPSVIADVVAEVVNAKKPKTRYIKGAMARPMVFMRRFLGDRGFDKVLRRTMLGQK